MASTEASAIPHFGAPNGAAPIFYVPPPASTPTSSSSAQQQQQQQQLAPAATAASAAPTFLYGGIASTVGDRPVPDGFDDAFRTFSSTYRTLARLAIVHCVLWFPIGFAFMTTVGRGWHGRGRLHRWLGWAFFLLAFVMMYLFAMFQMWLGPYVVLIWAPHVFFSVLSVVFAAKYENLEESLRMVDDVAFQAYFDEFIELVGEESRASRRFAFGAGARGMMHGRKRHRLF